MKPEQLGGLPDDGFVKINIYTTLAVKGGQAVARKVLNNLGNMFDKPALRELVRQGVLGEQVMSADHGENLQPLKPKLANVANPPRRDAWFSAVRDRCLEFLEMFRFGRYARR